MELKANELRIDNLVSDIHASESFYDKIKKITEDRIYYGNFHSHPKDLKPIPITEEWLLKFGFVKINRNFLLEFYNNGCFFYDLNKKEFWIGGYDSCASSQGFTVDNIEFVHQLQNIIFALTNEEL